MNRFCHLNNVQFESKTEYFQGCWFPTEQVGCYLLQCPDVGEKKLQAMIPWLLEEHVLDNPERLAWIAGGKNAENKLPVITANQQLLDETRQRLQANGAICEKLAPDFFMLPWQEGSVSIACIEGRCLVRSGPYQGMAGPVEWLRTLLTHQLGAELVLRVYGPVPELLAGNPGFSIETRPALGEEALPEQPWLGFAGHKAVGHGSNSMPAAICMGLAASLFAVIALGYLVETGRIKQQSAIIDEALNQAYAQATGETLNTGDMSFKSYFNRKLEDRIAFKNRDPMVLVRKVDELLNDCPNCLITDLSVDKAELVVKLAYTKEAEAWFSRQEFGNRDEGFSLSVAENNILLKVSNTF